jgi:hypothetical protein
MEESLHKLADLTEAAEFEGFKKPPTASTKPEKPAPEPFLCNRLRSRLPFWRSVCSSSFVLGIITVGFMLPWAAGGPPPAPWASANHASAFEHAEFVDTAVASLVTTGAVMRVNEAPFLVSPLGVVSKAENKLRLILDLQYLNQFLELTKFKYESIKSAPDLCAPGDFLFTVDLKSGYHHIDMYQEHWQYLGFQWRDQYYVFTQLPFGLAPACYVFTKAMRQLVKSWRSRGIRLIPYIDDFLFFCKDRTEFARVQAFVLAELAAAGLVVSKEKCQLSCTHVAKFLGFVVDSLFGQFRLSGLQKSKLLAAIDKCLSNPAAVSAKLLARVTGLTNSLSLVVGPISGLFSRFLHRSLNQRRS